MESDNQTSMSHKVTKTQGMDLASASKSCLNPFIEKVEVKNHAAKMAADRKIHVIERNLPPG